MTIQVQAPKGDVRWKSVYKSDHGGYDILMLDHSHKHLINKPTNITYCIKSLGFTQFIRSDDLNIVKDLIGMFTFHSFLEIGCITAHVE